MKFNEKLMELRKKQGLSQEELGYKLNVTRQTVSKWELGQTTPEMDKLLELSKLFNVSVDDLINDSDLENQTNQNRENIIEDQQIQKQESKNNKLYLILVGALVVVIILIIVKGVSGMMGLNKVNDTKENIFDRFFGLFDRTLSMQEKMFDDMLEQQNNMMGNFENTTNQLNTTSFNAQLEMYKGTKNGTLTKNLLNEIMTINEKAERAIFIKYKGEVILSEEEIKTLKMNIKDNNNYEILFKYDDEGFITEVILERVYTEYEKKAFNSTIEMYTGTKKGLIAGTALDMVITSNKTEERKITVKYKDLETQDEEKIRKIKQGFDSFDDFEIYVEYDEIGFINKVIIEKL